MVYERLMILQKSINNFVERDRIWRENYEICYCPLMLPITVQGIA